MKYRTIVADPPWPTKAGPLRGREGFLDANGATRDLPYSTMSVEEIAALPVSDLTAPDAFLFLWTTSGYLERAFGVVRAWGFNFSTVLVWPKAPMGGGLGSDAFGIATEFVLFARRGRLDPLRREGRNWWQWKRPYDERGKPRHSAKPPEFYDLVEQVAPGPRLELFARAHRFGWHVWGEEVDSDVALSSAA